MIYILNKQQEIISTLSNKGDMNKIVPYFEDIHIEELDSGVETFEFKTLSNVETSSDIQVGNYVAFKDEDCYKIFQIKEIQERHDKQIEKSVYCEGACLELLNEVVRPMTINSANLKQFLNTILDGTSWSVGMIDSSLNEIIHLDISEYENIYKLIQETVIEKFGGELRFRVEMENSRIISKCIDVFAKRGRVTNYRFEYGVNMTSVEKVVDTSELVTALIGVGKDNLTFKDVEANDKPKNQDFIVSEDAYNRWNNNGSHIMGVFDCESESPQELLKLTREELQRRSEPKVTYNLEVELLGVDVSLGDEVFVIDNEFTPPLYLSARVSMLEKSKTDKQSNRCTLSNFKEVKSNITSEMRALASSLEGKVDDKINKKFPVSSENIDSGAITEGKIDSQYLTTIKSDIIAAGLIEAKELIADKADITDLNVLNGKVENLQADKANITDLNVINANISTLTADVAEIDTLLAGNITADNIQAGSITSKEIATGTITAGSGIVAEGAIGSAQISELDAVKIVAGTVDTSKVTVAGPNSNLKLSGNRLQVFQGTGNNQVERVSLGDIQGDGTQYGFLVRGNDGKTVIMDENGVTNAGITDGSITNEKINPEANIDGAKLNIDSVINKINEDGSETIQGSKIDIEGTNLSAKLSSITTSQTEQGKKISQNSSKIAANESAINLKVDFQTYQSDQDGINTKLNKNTSDIKAMKDQISLKVEATDIENAKAEVEGNIDKKVNAAKAEIKITTDRISQNVSNLSSTVETKADGSSVSTLSNKVGSLETSINGISGKVSSLETTTTNISSTANSALSKANAAQSTANNANSLADSKAKVFTSTPTVPYKVGDIWTSGSSGDLMKCKTSRTTGSYTASDWEKASKYTDDSKANAVDGRVNNLQGEVTTVKGNVATIEANLSGITSRVGTVETNQTTINGKVTNIETWKKSAEQKITDSAIVSTVKASKDSNGKNTFAQQSDITQLNNSWTAKFSDGYNQGIVKMNKDGITVTSSGVKSKTLMSSTGFKITKTDTNEDIFKVNKDGTLAIKGAINATSGTFTGKINSGSTINGAVIKGGSFYTAADSTATDGHAFRIYSDGRVYSKKTIQVYGNKADGDYTQLEPHRVTTTGYVQSSGYKTDNMTMYFAIDGASVENPTGNNNRRIKLTRTSEGNTYFAPDYPSTSSSNGIRLGTQNYMWNILYSKNGTSSSSDRTLKENIHYISNDMPNKKAFIKMKDLIIQRDLYDFVRDDLCMAQFNFIGDDKTTVGFIAQDLLYNEDGSDNKIGQMIVDTPDQEQAPLTYNEKTYTNVLAGALRHSILKIETLEQENNLLKEKINKIEERLSFLEA